MYSYLHGESADCGKDRFRRCICGFRVARQWSLTYTQMRGSLRRRATHIAIAGGAVRIRRYLSGRTRRPTAGAVHSGRLPEPKECSRAVVPPVANISAPGAPSRSEEPPCRTRTLDRNRAEAHPLAILANCRRCGVESTKSSSSESLW